MLLRRQRSCSWRELAACRRGAREAHPSRLGLGLRSGEPCSSAGGEAARPLARSADMLRASEGCEGSSG